MESQKLLLRLLVVSCLALSTMAYSMKREREEAAAEPKFLTPVKKSALLSRVADSPQKAEVDARNTVRRMLDALNNPNEELAVQTALRAFAEWRQKFPAYFGKIHWQIALQGSETEEQFKYKLNSALDSALLMCIANGSHSRQDLVAPVFTSTDSMNQSQVSFGGFQMISKNHTDGKFGYEIMRTGARETLLYERNNSIKQTLTKCLFDKNDTARLQAGLEAVFSRIPQELRIRKEQFYHALIYGMISFLGSNFGQIEVYTGQGRADLIVQHDELGKCIIEFKLNSNARSALAQIQAQKYSMYFGSGNVLAVGINIKHDPLTVTCAKKMITIPSPQVTGKKDKAGSSVASFSGSY